ncbi:MAG: hypothetical protein U1E65_33785 [Myxococcota bacterium]
MAILRMLALLFGLGLIAASPSVALGLEPLLPLELGTRWTYVENGRPVAITDVSAGPMFEGVSTVRLRGGGCEPFGADQLVVADGAGLRRVAFYQSDRPPLAAKATLLPRGPKEALEPVVVPAGRFLAMKLSVEGGEFWFAPGVGLIKMRCQGTSAELVRVEHRPPNLAPKTRGSLALRLEPISGVKAGVPFHLQVQLRNVGTEPAYALPALDGSLDGRRAPKYTLELKRLDGPPLPPLDFSGFCGFINPLRSSDFEILAPGEALDPFGPRSFGQAAAELRLEHPGRYRLRVVYDPSASALEDWRIREGAASSGVLARWKLLPRERLEASIEVEVTP